MEAEVTVTHEATARRMAGFLLPGLPRYPRRYPPAAIQYNSIVRQCAALRRSRRREVSIFGPLCPKWPRRMLQERRSPLSPYWDTPPETRKAPVCCPVVGHKKKSPRELGVACSGACYPKVVSLARFIGNNISVGATSPIVKGFVVPARQEHTPGLPPDLRG